MDQSWLRHHRTCQLSSFLRSTPKEHKQEASLQPKTLHTEKALNPTCGTLSFSSWRILPLRSGDLHSCTRASNIARFSCNQFGSSLTRALTRATPWNCKSPTPPRYCCETTIARGLPGVGGGVPGFRLGLRVWLEFRVWLGFRGWLGFSIWLPCGWLGFRVCAGLAGFWGSWGGEAGI
jgi:hypothetical protein